MAEYEVKQLAEMIRVSRFNWMMADLGPGKLFGGCDYEWRGLVISFEA
jgi:hypothetical protein